MITLTKKDYLRLKKSVNEIIFNHSNGGFVIDLSTDLNQVYLDYFNFCLVWHYYLVQLIEIDDFETCVLIKQIIEEEKEEVIMNMYLAGIYVVGAAGYLDSLEESARNKQTKENKWNDTNNWKDEK